MTISSTGAHHDEFAMTSVSGGERVDRVIVDFHMQITTGDSAVLGTWLDRGLLVVVQWVEGTFPVDPPGDIGEANLDAIDVMASAYTQLEASTVFTDRYVIPAQGDALRLDTPVHRQPAPGNVGFVYLTWGLANFAGAGVEVGFAKVFHRVLLDSPFV